jgi:hypothetical protein
LAKEVEAPVQKIPKIDPEAVADGRVQKILDEQKVEVSSNSKGIEKLTSWFKRKEKPKAE